MEHVCYKNGPSTGQNMGKCMWTHVSKETMNSQLKHNSLHWQWTDETGEGHNYTNCSSAPHIPHMTHIVTLKIEAVPIAAVHLTFHT